MIKRTLHMIRKFFGLGVNSSSMVEAPESKRKCAVNQSEPDSRKGLIIDGTISSEKNRSLQYQNNLPGPSVSSDVLAYTHIEDELLNDLGLLYPEKSMDRNTDTNNL